MAWGSGLSNFGQAYQAGNAQNPFFKMQGMLPQAGLQPGSVPGVGGFGGGVPILGKPMLPPGVTPEQAMLPGGIPGLGAPLPKPPPAKPKPKAVVKKAPVYKDENRRDHDRGPGS